MKRLLIISLLLLYSCEFGTYTTVRMHSPYVWFIEKEEAKNYNQFKWRYLRYTIYHDEDGKPYKEYKWVYSDYDFPLTRMDLIADSTTVYYTRR